MPRFFDKNLRGLIASRGHIELGVADLPDGSFAGLCSSLCMASSAVGNTVQCIKLRTDDADGELKPVGSPVHRQADRWRPAEGRVTFGGDIRIDGADGEADA